MKRYGEKTLREALENGAIIREIDDPMRGPIWRVMIDGEISGYIVMDLFTKLNHDGTIEKSGYGYMYQDFSAKREPTEEEWAAMSERVHREVSEWVKVIFGEETTETETTETETTDRDATATGRRFYDTEHNICITDFDLLEEWKNDPCIRREYPWFDWYVAACQTYQGGTLEEIR